MISRNVLVLVVAIAGGGCLQITPTDGALQCSTVGSKCPTGYWCAGDNTCWHMGKSPSTTARPDMGTGASGDMAGAPDSDMPPSTVGMSCMLPSDCPTPAMPCLSAACFNGECALVAAAPGTVLPDNLQTPHDCQKLVCNANGVAANTPDTSDVPLDQTGGCFTTSCTGATPSYAPTKAGTACTQQASGICNGTGVCGACLPGATKCGSNTQLLACSPDGQWTNSRACMTCPAGTNNCTAPCTTTSDPPKCSGSYSYQCVSGMITGSDCSINGGCCNDATRPDGQPNTNYGMCNGTSTQCPPNTAPHCSGNSIVSCDSCGLQKTVTCGGATPLCYDDPTAGARCVQCTPGATQCDPNGSAVDTCSGAPSYQWVASPCSGGTNVTWSCNTSTGAPACHCSVTAANAAAQCSGIQCGSYTLCSGSEATTIYCPYPSATSDDWACSDTQVCTLHKCKTPTTTTTSSNTSCHTTTCI